MGDPKQIYTSVWTALQGAEDKLGRLRTEYERSLDETEATPSIQIQVKNILEDQRSALDYLAFSITHRFGAPKPGTIIYYPLVPKSDNFESAINGRLPGVREARPDIAAAIEHHQPYQPDHEWLGLLGSFVNENKHEQPTPQAKTETLKFRIGGADPSRGAVRRLQDGAPRAFITISGDGITWTPAQAGRGGVTFRPGGSIGGIPIDPITQRPVPEAAHLVREEWHVEWNFASQKHTGPVLETLRRIQTVVGSTLKDIISVAGS